VDNKLQDLDRSVADTQNKAEHLGERINELNRLGGMELNSPLSNNSQVTEGELGGRGMNPGVNNCDVRISNQNISNVQEPFSRPNQFVFSDISLLKFGNRHNESPLHYIKG
jgi:hypothetical protein